MGFVNFALFAVCVFSVIKAQEGYILATSRQRQNSKSRIHENSEDAAAADAAASSSIDSDANIFGIAGKDYPNFNTIPETQFDCDSQLYPGYYADPETDCQVYHICQPAGRRDSFLCANGTIFNQERLVCEWWHNVDCSQTKAKYSVNEAIVKAMEEIDRLNAERKAAQAFEVKHQFSQIRGEIHDVQQPPLGYRIKNNANIKKIKNNFPTESTDEVLAFAAGKYKSNTSRGSNYRSQFGKITVI